MRGQVSIELLIIMIILVGIFSFILTTTTSRQSEFVSSRDILHAKEIVDEVAFSMNEVFLAGSNTTKTLTLPSNLRGGANYTLLFYDKARLLEIRYSYNTTFNTSYTAPLLTSNITGSFPVAGGIVNITYISGGLNISVTGPCGEDCQD